ncbi:MULTISPECIES: hypothetical protein [unclassified Cryobacterium]|uniref:hypothetical protein n=1 Tax=unclassified Cryobacterium TaxID=2649013 RepID=UPI000CE444FC|nr:MULTISPECIES: hypothetical protein [unclassified Cryobacterium]
MTQNRLEVDTGAVRSLAENFDVVRRGLSDASAVGVELGTMVGHAHLASVIDDFSSKWDDRRTELTEQLTQMHTMGQAVADGFESVDSGLARALTETPSS